MILVELKHQYICTASYVSTAAYKWSYIKAGKMNPEFQDVCSFIICMLLNSTE